MTRGWLNHVCGHRSAKPASAVRSDAWLEDELDDDVRDTSVPADEED